MALDNVIILFTNRHLESTKDACQHIVGQMHQRNIEFRKMIDINTDEDHMFHFWI